MKKYILWCSYCGVDLILEQETQPTPHQLICEQCLSILDSYQEKSNVDVLNNQDSSEN